MISKSRPTINSATLPASFYYNKLKLGLCCDIIIFLLFLSYFSSFFSDSFFFSFSNIPLFTVYHFEILRIFVDFVTVKNFFDLIFGLFFVLTIVNNTPRLDFCYCIWLYHKQIQRYFLSEIHR